MGLAMFFLGAHAVVVQLLLMREWLASFPGGELVLGAVFGAWFAGVALGAAPGRLVARRAGSQAVRLFLNWLLFALVLLPPLLVAAWMRGLPGMPFHEGLPFGDAFRRFTLLVIPAAVVQGAAFPCACRLAGEGRRQGISRLYGLESAGGLFSALGAGLALAAGCAPLALALTASALALAAFAGSLSRRPLRALAMLAALATGALPWVFGGEVERLARLWEAPRWEALGATGPAVRGETPSRRLTVFPIQEQSVLVANSRPLFRFPDPGAAEARVRGILARHGAPSRVLLLGGNPVDLGRALLAQPGVHVTVVAPDDGVWRLTGGPAALDRRRCSFVPMDPVWYARQAGSNAFDIVLLEVPEPETAGMNRFYTLEFYQSLRRLLRGNGFLWTSVEAEEPLRAETGLLAASVHRTLRTAFPAVEASYGRRIDFMASERPPASGKAADPVLAERTRAALEGLPAPVNTWRQPVARPFMLLRWNQSPGATRLDRMLWRMTTWRGACAARRIAVGMCVAMLLVTGVMMVLKGRRRAEMVRRYLRLSAAMAGFSAMAYLMILIVLTQSLFGNLYVRLPFLAALFMAGLTAGAWMAGRYEQREPRVAWGLALAASAVLVMLGVAMPAWLDAPDAVLAMAEWLLHGSVVAAGGVIGMLFPMINRLLRDSGDPYLSAVGSTHASETAGAALGAVTVGLVLIPALGFAMACFLVALANALLALGLAAARRID